MAKNDEDGRSKDAGLGGIQRLALFTLIGVLVLSVVARAFVGESEPPSGPAVGPEGASSFVAGAPGSDSSDGSVEAAESGTLEDLLPVFTETSFFALIGFALGYATRKVVKLMLIFVAIFFAGIQLLVYAGVADVDWGQAIELLNGLILNVKEEQTFTEIAKAKVPSFGGLAGGYLLGFRRG
ncbi:MAG: FUN14 domain-containing protein [Planctomycetota bacterium]|jgi:uncharacterized membrane protein (Fun14 family)